MSRGYSGRCAARRCSCGKCPPSRRARFDLVAYWQRSDKCLLHDPPSESITGMTHSLQEEQHDLVLEAGVPAEEVAARDLLYQVWTWYFGEEVVRA